MLLLPVEGGASITPYVYDDVSEPNRTALWVFDNVAAGDIADQIGSNDLTQTPDTHRYRYGSGHAEPLDSYWTNFKGISGADSTVNRFSNTALSGVEPGTSDWTAEVWYYGAGGSATDIIYFYDSSSGSYIELYTVQSNGTTNGSVTLLARNDAASTLNTNFQAAAPYYQSAIDGRLHKVRIVRDVAATRWQVYFDGLLLINVVSASAGGTISVDAVRFTLAGRGIAAARISHNKTNNSGGPNGG